MMATVIAKTTLSKAQLHILQHSLGVDHNGRGRQYRNHFVTDAEGVDGQLCESLVALGMMTRRDGMGELTGGMPCYLVTSAGRVAVEDARPKLTKAQERYQRFLEADPGLSFFSWLKQQKNRHPFESFQ